MRYLVSGATGFVGGALCESLASDGHQVLALTRKHQPIAHHPNITNLYFGSVLSDLSSEDLSGVDFVVHCAGNAKFGNGADYQTANVEFTRDLISLIIDKLPALKRFVFISTIGVIDRSFGDWCMAPLTEESPCVPSTDYGQSKLDAERVVINSGVPFSIIRPCMVVGKNMRVESHFSAFSRWAIEGRFLAKFSWPGRFSVIHIDDLVSAIEVVSCCEDAESETYICAGDPISIGENYNSARPDTLRLSLDKLAHVMRPLIACFPFSLKSLLLPALVADDSKLRGLGWEPKIGANDALRDVIQREQYRFDITFPPDGQTVITGAASGLGYSLAKKLASMGRSLLLVDVDQDRLREVARETGDSRYVVTDLTTGEGMSALLKSKDWNAQPVLELFACAGIGFRGAIDNFSAQKSLKMIELNLNARIELAHSVLPGMKKRQFGRILFISSSSAFQPLPWMAVYAASNAALLSLGLSWAEEIKGNGVAMQTICPGGMDTNFQAAGGVRRLQNEKLASPDHVAALILQGLSKPQSVQVISGRSKAMSVLSRLIPLKFQAPLWAFLMRKMR